MNHDEIDPFRIKKPYNGPGIVAFLDLLGFSSAIRSKWKDGTALKKLMQVRKDIDEYKRIAFTIQNYPPNANGYAETALFSDSIIIFANAYDYGNKCLVWPAFLAISGKIQAAIGSAAKAGFGLRGGVEMGEVYWDGNDAIGPGFLDAYLIETKVKTARVVAGPNLLRQLSGEIPGSSAMHHHSASFLGRCDDGCFAFSGSKENVEDFRLLKESSSDEHKYKYDDIIRISNLENKEERKIRPKYYENAALAIERKFI